MKMNKKRNIILSIIVALTVCGVFGVYKYKEVQKEREQQTLNQIEMWFDELDEISEMYNSFDEGYYFSVDEREEFRSLKEYTKELRREIEKYNVEDFSRKEEYELMINNLIVATKEFEEGIDDYLNYKTTYNYDKFDEHSNHMDKYNDLFNKIEDFIYDNEVEETEIKEF